MKLFNLTILLLATIVSANNVFASPTEVPANDEQPATPSLQEQTNQLVDAVVKSLTSMRSFDPIVIPDGTIHVVHEKPLEINTKVSIRDTKLYGLSQVSRKGDAELDQSGGFKAKLKMGDNNVIFESKATLDDIKLIPKLGLKAEIAYIDIMIQIGVENDGSFSVNDFKILDYNNMKVQVTGLGPLNVFVDLIADAYLGYLKKDAEKTLTINVLPILKDVLKNMKMGGGN